MTGVARRLPGTREAGSLAVLCLALVLGACGTAPSRSVPEREPASTPPRSAPSTPPVAKAPDPPQPARPGGYYLDDGPADSPPPDLDKLPDPRPRAEPLHRFANNPYTALGRYYVPQRELRPFRQRGVASWYGRRFHGGRTASGEIYDMFQLSAAHPTLPIPSYARVTNTQNGRQVIVRINDRGPFLHGRVIDLSYAAAAKLGYVEQGSAPVEVDSITVAEIDALAAQGTPAPVGGPQAMLETRGPQQGFPVFAEREGVFVQLGAFASPTNAEGLRARLILELASLVDSLQVVLHNGLHRVWAGPYRDRNEASRAAMRLATVFR